MTGHFHLKLIYTDTYYSFLDKNKIIILIEISIETHQIKEINKYYASGHLLQWWKEVEFLHNDVGSNSVGDYKEIVTYHKYITSNLNCILTKLLLSTKKKCKKDYLNIYHKKNYGHLCNFIKSKFVVFYLSFTYMCF